MNAHAVDVKHAERHLAELVAEVVRGGEVVLTEQGRKVAKIVPVAPRKAEPQFGSAKGLFTMADDFDDPLPEFEPYKY